MQAKEFLIGFGRILGGFAVLCITLIVPTTIVLCFHGTVFEREKTTIYLGLVWITSKLLLLLAVLAVILLPVIVCILLPMAIPRATRGYSGMALGWIAIVFLVTLWMDSLVITLKAYGFIGGMRGLSTVVGVIPMAILATLISGMWFRFGELMMLLMITIFCWIVGALFQRSSLRGE